MNINFIKRTSGFGLLLFFILGLCSTPTLAQINYGNVDLINYSGGVCDGVHSTNAAFMSAVADLGAAGGTINVPSGQCLITSTSTVIAGHAAANSTSLTLQSASGIQVGSNATLLVGTTSPYLQPNTVVTALSLNPDASTYTATLSRPTIATIPTSTNITFYTGLVFTGGITINLVGQGFNNGSSQYSSVLTCSTGYANCITFDHVIGGGMQDLQVQAETYYSGTISTPVQAAGSNEIQVAIPQLKDTIKVTTTTGSAGNLAVITSGNTTGVKLGMAVYDPNGVFPPYTMVQYIGSTVSGTAFPSNTASNIIAVNSISNVVLNMPVTDMGASNCIPSGSVVERIYPAVGMNLPQIQISNAVTCASGTSVSVQFAGGSGTINLSNSATQASFQLPLAFFPFIPTVYKSGGSPVTADIVNIPGISNGSQGLNGAWILDPSSVSVTEQSSTPPITAGSIIFNLAAQSNTQTNPVASAYSFTAICSVTNASTDVYNCGPSPTTPVAANIIAAGQTVSGTGVPSGSTVASALGSSFTLSPSAATVTGVETLTFTNSIGSGNAIQAFQMKPGTYEMVVMGSTVRPHFERVEFSQGMNAINFLNSNGMGFLFANFIGFYDQQVLLFNGASDPEQPQGFSCYQCTVSSKNLTTDNVVFDGNTASHFFRDSYIAQNARRGIWVANRYGGICPGDIQISGSGIGEGAVGSSIQLDCGEYFMIHDVIDLVNGGGGYFGLDGFGINEGPDWTGSLIVTNNNMRGSRRDAIRLAGGYAQVNNNFITNSGAFNDPHYTLQITGVTDNGSNLMRVTYAAPGPWAPNPRDWVTITGAVGAAGNWEVAPVSGSGAYATQFDLLNSKYHFTAGGSVSGSTVTVAVASTMVVGQGITDSGNCIPSGTIVSAVNASTLTISKSASSCSNDTFTFVNSYSSTGASTLALALLQGDGIRILPGATNIQASLNKIGPDFPPSTNRQSYGVRNDGDLTAAEVPLNVPQIVASVSSSTNCFYNGVCPYRITPNSSIPWTLIQGDLVTISSSQSPIAPPALNGTWPVAPIAGTSPQQYDLIGSTYDTSYTATTYTGVSVAAQTTTITLPGTSTISVGMGIVSAAGITAAGTTITGVNSVTNVVTLSQATTNTTSTSSTLKFGPVLAPASQSIVSVEHNDLTGNVIAGDYSGKYQSDILFRSNNGVEQSDVTYTAAVANVTATTPTLLAYVSGKKVLITRITTSQTGATLCSIYPAVLSNPMENAVNVNSGATITYRYPTPFLVDGTNGPVALQYKFDSCNLATSASVQFEGINID